MKTNTEDQFFDCNGKPIRAGDIIVLKDPQNPKTGRALKVIPKWVDGEPRLHAEFDWGDQFGTVKAIIRLSGSIELMSDPNEMAMYVLSRIGK